MTTKVVAEIIKEKLEAGADAFLVVIAEDCWVELWPSEEICDCDVGDLQNTINSWFLDPDEFRELIETGLADREE